MPQSILKTEDLVDDAVNAAKILSGAVGEAELASNAVTEGKVATGAITETKIGASAITENKLGSLAVTNGKLGALAVTDDKISGVAGSKVSGAVSSANYATSAGTAGSAGSATTAGRITGGMIEVPIQNPTFSGGTTTGWTVSGTVVGSSERWAGMGAIDITTGGYVEQTFTCSAMSPDNKYFSLSILAKKIPGSSGPGLTIIWPDGHTESVTFSWSEGELKVLTLYSAWYAYTAGNVTIRITGGTLGTQNRVFAAKFYCLAPY